MIAFCALLSLEAETIFMALVICLVDLTEAILVRTSFKFAINYMIRLFLVFVSDIGSSLLQHFYSIISKFSSTKIF